MWPHLFHLGAFTVPSYGVLVTLGFVAAICLAMKLASERGLPGDAFLEAANYILFAGIAGSRLLFVALNWKLFQAQPQHIAAFWEGGMSFHGGIIAGTIAGLLFMRSHKLPLLAMLDAAAPAITLGYVIGRIGCLLNGCCYGGPTELPWGLHMPAPADPHLRYHPAQVYASILNVGLLLLLLRAYRQPHRSGQIIALYVAGYSLYRFAIESIRSGVTAHVLILSLTQAQVFSLLCLGAALMWWRWLRRNAPAAPEAISTSSGPSTAPAPPESPTPPQPAAG
jgi:phosphatidylglycerol---prolipoprotein diacylglyceryl transferase